MREFIEAVGQHKVVNLWCTRGKHRSVAVAEVLAKLLRIDGHRVFVYHKSLLRHPT